MNTHEIVKKLVGSIKPVGETTEDNNRFENLKNLTTLIENLLYDIDNVAFDNKDAKEYSVKRAADHCKGFLIRITTEFAQ